MCVGPKGSLWQAYIGTNTPNPGDECMGIGLHTDTLHKSTEGWAQTHPPVHGWVLALSIEESH